jgi:hypothetical protein
MYVENLERLTIWKRGSIFYATYDSKLNTWSTKLFIDPRFSNREIAPYSICPTLKDVDEAVTHTNVGGKRLCNHYETSAPDARLQQHAAWDLCSG